MAKLTPQIPAGLSAKAQQLWLATVPSRARSAERQVMIEQALIELDRADLLRAKLDATGGLIVTSKRSKLVRPNPILALEQRSRATFTRLWFRLSLDWNGQIDGRHD